MRLSDEDVGRIALAVRQSMVRQEEQPHDESRLREFSRLELVQHHRFVAQLIAEKEAKRELWLDMRKHVIKWGAVGILTALGVMAWFYAKNVIVDVVQTAKIGH